MFDHINSVIIDRPNCTTDYFSAYCASIANKPVKGTVWRVVPIEDLGHYAVSDMGDVMRLTNGRGVKAGHVAAQRTDPAGYWRLSVYTPDRRKVVVRTHVLVALAFCGPKPTPEHQVAHWDGDKDHNCASNLRWATPREQTDDKARHGTIPRGEDVTVHILTEDEVREMRMVYALATPRPTYTALGKRYGVTTGHARRIVLHQRWTWLP